MNESASSSTNPGCLSALLRILFGSGASSATGPRDDVGPAREAADAYRLRAALLSPAELSFYQVLAKVVGERLTICPMVRLCDVFDVVGGDGRQAAHNRISSKHVDFVLCEPATMHIVAGIELDDATHRQRKREERDRFLEGLFERAGLPLLRVPARAGYAAAELARLLAPVLPVPSAEPAAPSCPRCGVPMTLRVAGRGEHTGESFYGCANFPRCREVRDAA